MSKQIATATMNTSPPPLSLQEQFFEMRKMWVEWGQWVEPETVLQALGWAVTEIGEAMEIALMEQAEWVRNNPESHQTINDFGLELADIVMMVMVAGDKYGINVLDCLKQKMWQMNDKRKQRYTSESNHMV